MKKIKKTIRGLECCIKRDPDDYLRCDECPYPDGSACANRLKIDALELLKERQWISVKDRLPEDDTKVLVLTQKGRMRVARVTVPHQRINKRYDPLEAWWWVDGFDRNVNATHWMPLPSTEELDDE